jgi:preprotein translocase subunit SecE
MDQIILYLKESYNELVHKVTWPSWNSLLSSTRLVLVASLIIALLILAMDFISRQVVGIIYNI